MHRAACRAFRGSCRKWRESEYPTVSGDDTKTNNKWNHEFVPPKHTWNEALGWTTGLVLAWQLTHRKCTFGEDTPFISSVNKKCPFGVTTKVASQPIVSTVNYVGQTKRSSTHQRKSIDATPFLKEDKDNLSLFGSSFSFKKDSTDADDCDIVFEEESKVPVKLNLFKSSVPLQTKRLEEKEPVENKKPNIDGIVDRLSADLYSALGAFTFLHKGQGQYPHGKENGKLCEIGVIGGTPSSNTPPISAMELLCKGAELGSARAFYNIGVAYDRMQEPKLAHEYYRKATDLGHPLATYNSSIFSLKDGDFAEGLALMRVAAQKGVPEAKRVLKDFNE